MGSFRRRCVQEVRQRDAALRTGSPDQLARAVKQALLDSDLSQVVAPSYTRISPDRLRSGASKVGDAGRGAVLVQVESMIDIGYSASSQLEIAEARREARRANVNPNEMLDESKVAASSAGADHMVDFQAQEDDKVQATTIFPRRMLKLELCDGSKSGTLFGIELQRIPGLDMNTTKIGTKLLIKGAVVKDDCLFLTPQTVVVEGGSVREKDEVAEDKFIEKLRAQLGKPAEEQKTADTDTTPSSIRAAAEPSRNTAAARVQRQFSPNEDESELLAALEAEEEMMMSSTTSARNASASRAPPAISEQAPPPRQRAVLKVPEGTSQTVAGKSSRSQRSETTATRSNATQEDPISLIDSDDDMDDALFASIDDSMLSASATESKVGSSGQTRRDVQTSNSRDDPIVIESSPEP